MQSIPSFRAAHLLPYAQFLRRVGTPVDRLLSRARLPTMFEDHLEAYLPLQPALRFLAMASHLEGIDELGLATTKDVRITDLNPVFVVAAQAAPTLNLALEHYCQMGYAGKHQCSFLAGLRPRTNKAMCFTQGRR